jgi:hypothetical protein
MAQKKVIRQRAPKSPKVENAIKALSLISNSPEVGNHAVVRESVLHVLDGLGTTQRNEKIRLGQYPAPIKISDSGRAKCWFLREIVAWQEERRRLRDEKLARDARVA